MALGFLKKIVGNPNERALKELEPLVEAVNALEPAVHALDDVHRSRVAVSAPTGWRSSQATWNAVPPPCWTSAPTAAAPSPSLSDSRAAARPPPTRSGPASVSSIARTASSTRLRRDTSARSRSRSTAPAA